jgi:ornithine cyclodeaminase
MKTINLTEIKAALDIPTAIKLIEEGFVALTEGRATVPPVGYLGFEHPPGDCHIKYGYIHDDDVFVIKIACGFFENSAIGLPTGSGMMIVMSAKTGHPQALLLDEGYLTEVRTAIAGAICARYLAPTEVECIGIVGAGYQARMQLEYLAQVSDCRNVMVWARRDEQAAAYQEEMSNAGYTVRVAPNLEELCKISRLIVTTTPARAPLIRSDWIQPGTHITAMGADADGKQEIEAALFARAAVCAVDSRSQCVDHGDSHHAITGNFIRAEDLVELGSIISGQHAGRSSADDITIADLTGVAVQDIQIAKAVWTALGAQP